MRKVNKEVSDMRGLFFIVKGQYSNKKEPMIHNSVSDGDMYIGGYDPSSPLTPEWYMLLDRRTYTVVCCGSDLNKVVKGVYTQIKKHKGVTNRYLKHIAESDSLVSKVMVCLYEHIYQHYGDYFRDLVEEQEELAYRDIESGANKLALKTKTPQKEEVVLGDKKVKKPKVVLGLKRA